MIFAEKKANWAIIVNWIPSNCIRQSIEQLRSSIAVVQLKYLKLDGPIDNRLPLKCTDIVVFHKMLNTDLKAQYVAKHGREQSNLEQDVSPFKTGTKNYFRERDRAEGNYA
ncbi:hypothetical protein CEXT_512511 [Caerostris extrusa]|uniref:Uncharacterized protein n=1 Tax=Caerostris extrusa TaxID=172846 RepID=A0AAV4UT68_CAEEX|nr:hypothetical protein CEXT_512511 [Caerostris extrusa]